MAAVKPIDVVCPRCGSRDSVYHVEYAPVTRLVRRVRDGRIAVDSSGDYGDGESPTPSVFRCKARVRDPGRIVCGYEWSVPDGWEELIDWE